MKKIFLSISLFAALSVAADTRIMVIADPHVMHTDLFDDGTAAQNMFAGNPRVPEHSMQLFDSAMTIVAKACPDLLFIVGDLANEGELVSHEHIVAKLAQLAEIGVQTLVIPGNNDIANPNAKSYSGTSKKSVPSVTAAEFETMYNDFGFKQAVLREEGGLSYMAYPNDQLAVICLNSAKENTPTTQYNAGGLYEETLAFAEQAAAKAAADHRMILTLMHHQAMDHFNLESTMTPTYVANTGDDYPALIDMQDRLLAAGVEVIFTGHFHMNSISRVDDLEGVHSLFDVSTGSLSSYPSPIRSINLTDNGVMTISTATIDTYHALEQERNTNTAKGLINTLASKLYPYVDTVKNKMPTLAAQLNLPASEAAMSTDMQKYMLESLLVMVNELSAGDEHLNDPETKQQAVMTGFDNYISYVCKDNAFLISGVKALLVAPRLVLQNMSKSIFYNYVGLDETDVVEDNANTITISTNSQSTAVEDILAPTNGLQKEIINGVLYINRDGERYTTTGVLVE